VIIELDLGDAHRLTSAMYLRNRCHRLRFGSGNAGVADAWHHKKLNAKDDQKLTAGDTCRLPLHTRLARVTRRAIQRLESYCRGSVVSSWCFDHERHSPKANHVITTNLLFSRTCGVPHLGSLTRIGFIVRIDPMYGDN